MIIDRDTLRIRCYETSNYPDVLRRLHEATLRGVGAYVEDEGWDEDLCDIESTYLGDGERNQVSDGYPSLPSGFVSP